MSNKRIKKKRMKKAKYFKLSIDGMKEPSREIKHWLRLTEDKIMNYLKHNKIKYEIISPINKIIEGPMKEVISELMRLEMFYGSITYRVVTE